MSVVEGSADLIAYERMGRKQHMLWLTRGVFQILRAGVDDINGTLEEKFLSEWHPTLRKISLC